MPWWAYLLIWIVVVALAVAFVHSGHKRKTKD